MSMNLIDISGWQNGLNLEQMFNKNPNLRGGDPIAEAEFFYKNTSAYFHEGIPVAGYEAQALLAGTGYLKRFLDQVYELSGVKPLVYTSLLSIWGYGVPDRRHPQNDAR